MKNDCCFSFAVSLMVALLLLNPCTGETVSGQIGTQFVCGTIFKHDTAAKTIDIAVNGAFFTTFRYSGSLEKPVFSPVHTPSGLAVTRGFPLAPKQGERIDHPHQSGVWFNYGSVNGLDFWNNSPAVPGEKKCLYGNIVCIEDSIRTNSPGGSLATYCEWFNCRGEVLLRESAVFVFRGFGGNLFLMERITRLTAVADSVIFGDSKEGLFAVRVGRPFEMPSDKPAVLFDTLSGGAGVPRIDSSGVTGSYRGSNGLSGEAVWGTRNRWVTSSAVAEGDSISVAMIDHPDNQGFPSYWHARGYGLFSVNNFGVKSYDLHQPETRLVLKRDESIAFRHLLLVKSGGFLTGEETESYFRHFAEDDYTGEQWLGLDFQ